MAHGKGHRVQSAGTLDRNGVPVASYPVASYYVADAAPTAQGQHHDKIQ